jgi:pectate lyase
MSLTRSLSGRLAASALLALTATSFALAQTHAPITVFYDDFTGGSTVNSNPTSPAAPTMGKAAYQVISGQAKPTVTPPLPADKSVLPGNLRLALDSSGATANILAEALFTQYPVKLASDQDYVELMFTFTAETALLVDSANTGGNDANLIYAGLYGSSGSTAHPSVTKDNVDSPLSAYVHEPNEAIAGGQISASSSIQKDYPAYWRGYTTHIARAGGRHQVWYQNSANTANSGSSSGLNNRADSTLAPLTATQQYTALLRITRINSVSNGVISTKLLLKEELYAGTGGGTPLVSWESTQVSSSSQHMGVVYDALAVGFKVNSNSDGFAQIMAVNSIKVVTTGKVLVAPVILTQPAALNVSLEDPITLSVVATAGGDDKAVLTYQWKKGGADIPGATADTYSIPMSAYTDAGDYSVVVTSNYKNTDESLTVVGSATSTTAHVAVNPPAPPSIATDPASQTAVSGSSATFTVQAVGSGLHYQWEKSTDGGATFTPIAGATSASYTIARTQTSSLAQYRVVVTNSTASVTSAAATLTLTYNFTSVTPAGYAASATGGSDATPSTVTTLDAFKAQAESAGAAVITVQGTINLNGKVSVKSDKTIQGIDGEATLIGNLEVGSGVSNVIIRGLNITNPAGNGLTISGASNVYVNHLSFYDCSDTLLAITNGADNVTVSWSEFYYTTAAEGNKATLVGATAGETKPLSVTFDHNWWSDNAASQMPDSTYGRVHMYNNLFQTTAGTDMGNSTATLVHANAQLFSERNQYTKVNNPITKEASTIGLVRSIDNAYTATSGTTYTVADFINFAPTYGYQLAPASSVSSQVSADAGNIAGASTSTPTPAGSVSITGSASSVPLEGSFTLTLETSGLDVVPDTPVAPYQWRLNGVRIGARTTEKTLTIGGASSSNTGNYSVEVLLANGDTAVSPAFTVAVSSGASTVPASESEGAGGGGAPSFWFMGALAMLAGIRRFVRR